jgi:hypothetical protein
MARLATFILAFVLLLGSAAPSATAKPKKKNLVTIAITAVVETVDDPSDVLCSNVAPGDTITGTYTYDSAVADSNELSYVGDYIFTSSPSGISLDLGDVVAQTAPTKTVDVLIEVVDDEPTDGADFYAVRSFTNLPLACGSPVDDIGWQLDDPTGTALSSTALPTQPPQLSAFQSIEGLTVSGTNAFAGYVIRAHVNSATRV